MKREHNKSIKEFAAQLEKLHKDLSAARGAALSQLADELFEKGARAKPEGRPSTFPQVIVPRTYLFNKSSSTVARRACCCGSESLRANSARRSASARTPARRDR